MNSAPDAALRQLLLSHIDGLLGHLNGHRSASECFAAHNDAWEVYVLISPRTKPESPAGLSEMDAAILQALSDGAVLTAKQLAKATGYAYSSHLRSRLTDLARRELLIRTPDGYRCP